MRYHKPEHAKKGAFPLEPVRFEFTHPTARSVSVAGTFNDWRSKTKFMIPLGNGRWQKQVALPPGTYEYCFVVDGKCMPDPLVKKTVANPFGGMNSVLKVGEGA
jgi:1,4-alpha-glucan branching enzyme